MKSRNTGDNNDAYAFMQAYYQSERALPPVDKSMASPVQAMMMMSSPAVDPRPWSAWLNESDKRYERYRNAQDR